MSKKLEELMESWDGDTSVNQWSTAYGVGVASAPKKKPLPDPLDAFSDADLILKLVERGYAVGKLNENNKLESK